MLRARQKLGKYRIRRRIGRGGYADVYEALDTIEGISVALKIPLGKYVDEDAMANFRKEVRMTARLDHPNILQIKNAEFINDRLVIAYPLGRGTLGERLRRRMSVRTCLEYAEQILDALAHAHDHRIIHCDIKSENLILFEDGSLRLADFGIAKIAMRTVQASGSGSVGYISPDQALGRPSQRSDVFSAGMIIYRMLTGHLPTWPFKWPHPGHEKLKKYGSELTAFLRKSMAVDPRKRYRNAAQMLSAFQRIKPKVLSHLTRKKNRRNGSASEADRRDWRTVRWNQYRKLYARHLHHDADCEHCGEPVDERMRACPWCGSKRDTHEGESQFPARCIRCNRGVKLDWNYCAWCHGASVGPQSERHYTDKRYTARCQGKSCKRRDLMPFMRYCPWCRVKVRKRWKLGGGRSHCSKCGGGIARGFWDYCAWCSAEVGSS